MELRTRTWEKPNHGSSTGETVEVRQVWNPNTGLWTDIEQMKQDLENAEKVFEAHIANYQSILTGIQLSKIILKDLK